MSKRKMQYQRRRKRKSGKVPMISSVTAPQPCPLRKETGSKYSSNRASSNLFDHLASHNCQLLKGRTLRPLVRSRGPTIRWMRPSHPRPIGEASRGFSMCSQLWFASTTAASIMPNQGQRPRQTPPVASLN